MGENMKLSVQHAVRGLVLCAALLLVSMGPIAAAQAPPRQPESPAPAPPSVQDLAFLIGTWERSFEFRDTHNPERGVTFTEAGLQTCRFGLELNGTPMFIICEAELVAQSGRLQGRRRQMIEIIRYNRFSGAFERVGHFANWPTRTVERLYYHPDERSLEIRGELLLADGVIERYEEFYRFNADFSSYTMRNVANFTNIPVTQFNLIYEGVASKR